MFCYYSNLIIILNNTLRNVVTKNNVTITHCTIKFERLLKSEANLQLRHMSQQVYVNLHALNGPSFYISKTQRSFQKRFRALSIKKFENNKINICQTP